MRRFKDVKQHHKTNTFRLSEQVERKNGRNARDRQVLQPATPQYHMNLVQTHLMQYTFFPPWPSYYPLKIFLPSTCRHDNLSCWALQPMPRPTHFIVSNGRIRPWKADQLVDFAPAQDSRVSPTASTVKDIQAIRQLETTVHPERCSFMVPPTWWRSWCQMTPQWTVDLGIFPQQAVHGVLESCVCGSAPSSCWQICWGLINGWLIQGRQLVQPDGL